MFCSNYARYIPLGDKVFVFNSLTGGAVLFSDAIKKHLLLGEDNRVSICDDLPHKIEGLLKERHILFENKESETHFIRDKEMSLLDKANNAHLISSIRLTLTKACNCQCCYCYVDKNTSELPLTVEESMRFISKIVSLNESSEFTIRFFGGEPTLESESIQRIISECRDQFPEHRFKYLLNTNGQWVSDELIRIIKEYNIKTVISLDSVKPINDIQRNSLVCGSYYDAATETIKRFVNMDLLFVVGAVLTDANIGYLPDFLKEMHSIGVRSLGLNHAKMVGSEIVSLNRNFADQIVDAYLFGINNKMNISGYWILPFKRLLKGTHMGFCGGLGYELDLRPDRMIYSCVGSNKPLSSLDAIDDIFSSKQYLDICQRIPPNIHPCNGCYLEGVCAGECACDAKCSCGDFNGINPKICDFQKYITNKLLACTFNFKPKG